MICLMDVSVFAVPCGCDTPLQTPLQGQTIGCGTFDPVYIGSETNLQNDNCFVLKILCKKCCSFVNLLSFAKKWHNSIFFSTCDKSCDLTFNSNL